MKLPHSSLIFLLTLILLTTNSPTILVGSLAFTPSPLTQKVRVDFPAINTDVVYLDSAASSQKPNFVIDAQSEFDRTTHSNVHRGAHKMSREATRRYEAARDSLVKFINADSRKEVIFTSGATNSLNLIAHSWGIHNLEPDSEIILSIMEHHSSIVPWQLVQQNFNPSVKIKFCPLNADNSDLDYDELEKMMNENTKVVSIVHTSNTLGITTDTKRIAEIKAKKAAEDSIYIVDGCQSLPHKKVDVQQLSCDFFVASAHKMVGPTGVGLLWGKESLLNKMPPFMGGGEMIDVVTTSGSTFADLPGKFEAGTPMIGQAIGWGVALEYIERIGGMEEIEKCESNIGKYLYTKLQEIPDVTLYGPTDPTKRAALAAFSVKGIHVSDIATFLDLEKIAIRAGHHCTQPLHDMLGISHTARASCYFYTTQQDVDVFIEKLKETIDFFKSQQSGSSDTSNEIDYFE